MSLALPQKKIVILQPENKSIKFWDLKSLKIDDKVSSCPPPTAWCIRLDQNPPPAPNTLPFTAPINNALWFCYWFVLLLSKLPESNNINSFNKYWMNVILIFTLPEPNTVSSIFKPSKLTKKGHIDINGSLLWIPDLYIPLPTLYLCLVTSKVLQNSLRTLYVLSATKKPALLQCSPAQWIQLWKPE